VLTNAMISDANSFCQITAFVSKSKGRTLWPALRPFAEATKRDKVIKWWNAPDLSSGMTAGKI